jgi:hypothetical protein
MVLYLPQMSKLAPSSLRIQFKQIPTPKRPKMPAFTLYGSRGSTNTDRIRLTLAEGGFTDYDVVWLDLRKGEQKVIK